VRRREAPPHQHLVRAVLELREQRGRLAQVGERLLVPIEADERLAE